MPFEFKLPDLGEGITEGEIVKWRVREGDEIEEHQVIAEIETDKAIVEVPSPKKGKVSQIKKKEGQTVNVGETLFTIQLDGEGGVRRPEEEKIEEKRERPPSMSVVGRVPEEEEVLASPKARSLAKKLGVDLSGVRGTGPGGIITEDDVKAASAGKEIGPPQEKRPEIAGRTERVAIKGVRKAIAKNLLASQRSAAFVTGMDDADVTDLWNLRKTEAKNAKERGIHLTFLPFIMKAVQHSILSHPFLNASVDEKGEEVLIKKFYNFGVAVQAPEGLMVAVVRDVEKKTILELAQELAELSKKARERKISLEELKGSTFTLSNYGSFGGTYATPIINYPDVAVLGIGRIGERPWVKNGQIIARRIMPLSLTFDHRIIDGAEAAIFLNKVISYLEDPAKIFIESA